MGYDKNNTQLSINGVSAHVRNSSSAVLNNQCAGGSGGCPSCQKDGDLFLLPLRYGVVGNLPDFPRLAVNAKLPPLSSAHYSIQMMRKGYLYLLEERSDLTRWRSFSVSEESCLTEMPADKLPDVPPKFNCSVTTHGVNAACINFSQSDQLKMVYLLFSPDKLTMARLDYYKDEGKNELQKISLQSLRAAQSEQGENGLDVVKVNQLPTSVLEFYLADIALERLGRGDINPYYDFMPGTNNAYRRQMIKSLTGLKVPLDSRESVNRPYSDFLFSLPVINETAHRYPALINVLNKYQGMGVVLNDAIGITQSLNNWRNAAIEDEFKDWMDERDKWGITNEHKYVIAEQITSLQQSYKEKRIVTLVRQGLDSFEHGLDNLSKDEREVLFKNEQERQAFLDKYGPAVVDLVIEKHTSEKSIHNLEKQFETMYNSKLDKAAIATFDRQFAQKSERSEKAAEERAEDIVKWLKSASLIQHLAIYDPEDQKQGILFAEQVGLFLLGTGSSPVIEKLLNQWWDANEVSEENLCLRSYYFNQKQGEEYLSAYITAQNQQEDDPDTWDILADGSKKAAKKIQDLGKFFAQINKQAEMMEKGDLPIVASSMAFADLGRRFLRAGTVTNFEKTLLQRFKGMVISGIGETAVNAKILDNIEHNLKNLEQKVLTSGELNKRQLQVQNYVKGNLEKSLTDIKTGNFYKVRLNMGLALLESFFLLTRIATFKSEGKEYAALGASVLMTSSLCFNTYANYAELSVPSKTAALSYRDMKIYSGRFNFYGGLTGFLAGGVMAVMDFVEGNTALDKNNTYLGMMYYSRSIFLLTYSLIRFTIAIESSSVWLSHISTKTENFIWKRMSKFLLSWAKLGKQFLPLLVMLSPYMMVGLTILTGIMIVLEGNALEQWFEKCYFAKRKNSEAPAYQTLEEELSEFMLAVKENV